MFLRKPGIFIAALFIIVKVRNSKCPLRDEWINKIWHFHAIEYYSVNKKTTKYWYMFSSVQSLSRVQLFATPWTVARQASLSITISRSSLRLTFIESMMLSSHLILCRPLLLLPPIPPSIRVFSNESTTKQKPIADKGSLQITKEEE